MDYSGNIGVALPSGYTPQTLSDFYSNITRPIDEETAMNAGKARTEAYAAGLEGTPAEYGGVAAARGYGQNAKSSALANLGYSVANLASGQNFQHTEGGLQRDWQAKENDLERGTKRWLAQLGYQEGAASEGRANLHAQQGALEDFGFKVAGNLLGPSFDKAGAGFAGLF